MLRILLIMGVILFWIMTIWGQVAVPPAFGDGSEDDPYQIATLENLYWIGTQETVPFPIYYLQTADIDASETSNWFDGAGWLPLSIAMVIDLDFRGNYDGNGYVIDNLYINRPDTNFVSLFGRTMNTQITNLGMTNVEITGNNLVGSIAGLVDLSSSVSNCYASGTVSGMGTNIGGLVGTIDMYATMENCYSLCHVNGSIYIGGLIGSWYWNDSINNCYYNYDEVLINGEHLYTLGAIPNNQFSSWLTNDLTLDIEDYFSSNGESYLINSFSDLKQLAAFGYDREVSFRLTTDLDLSNEENFYIPFFSGSFDGDGHIVSNLNLGMELYSEIGFFGITADATISNLGLVDLNVMGYNAVGGLVGANMDSTVNNCYIIGDVTGIWRAGGLIGHNGRYSGTSSPVSDSYSVGNVTGGMLVGGLIGFNDFYSPVTNCNSSSTVTGVSYVGGLIGSNNNLSEVMNSFSAGNVSGDERVGGLIGFSYGPVNGCYSTGDVHGTGNYIGGLVGNANQQTISNSYSTGNVTGTGNQVGGLVGRNTGCDLQNNYSTGLVTGASDVGGLIGLQLSSIISRCYWNIETSGQTSSAGGTGRTTEEMTFPFADNTYLNWDFEEIWTADEDYAVNNGYPYLSGNPPLHVEDEFLVIPPKISLSNYPNPFNPETTIHFTLPERTIVELVIYNIKGHKIRTLLQDIREAGEHRIIWNGQDERGRVVPSGVYLYQLITDRETISRKMILLK